MRIYHLPIILLLIKILLLGRVQTCLVDSLLSDLLSILNKSYLLIVQLTCYRVEQLLLIQIRQLLLGLHLLSLVYHLLVVRDLALGHVLGKPTHLHGVLVLLFFKGHWRQALLRVIVLLLLGEYELLLLGVLIEVDFNGLILF